MGTYSDQLHATEAHAAGRQKLDMFKGALEALNALDDENADMLIESGG